VAPHTAASATTGNSENRFVSTDSVVTVVQQIISELSEAVTEKDEIMAITKMALNETKWLLEFIGRSKS
jgi:hypothetical protein